MPHFTHDDVAVARIRDLCQRLALILGDLPSVTELMSARTELRELAEKDPVPQEVLQSLQLVECALHVRAALLKYHRWFHLERDRGVEAA